MEVVGIRVGVMVVGLTEGEREGLTVGVVGLAVGLIVGAVGENERVGAIVG